MGKKRKQLSHAEIWDDSALVDCWNSALEEYQVRGPSRSTSNVLMRSQFYHSIHARGERVEDVLKQAEAGEDAKDSPNDHTLPLSQANGHGEVEIEEELEDGEVEEEEEGQTATVGADQHAPVRRLDGKEAGSLLSPGQQEEPPELTQQSPSATGIRPEHQELASTGIPNTILDNGKCYGLSSESASG